MKNRTILIIALITVLFLLTGPARPQCKKPYLDHSTFTMEGVADGVDHYFRNLIVQDLAIAGQLKFNEIFLTFDFSVGFTTDQCRKGRAEISVHQLDVKLRPLPYRGFDISSSVLPSSADLTFYLVRPNGLVTDSLVFYGIKPGDSTRLYSSLTSPLSSDTVTLSAEFAHAEFRFDRPAYERFRDRILQIDDYYAASVIADSALAWINTGFLAENSSLAGMVARKMEIDRLLTAMVLSLEPAFQQTTEDDPLGLYKKIQQLQILERRYAAIIAGFPAIDDSIAFSNEMNQISEILFSFLDQYHLLTFHSDFRHANFLGSLARPDCLDTVMTRLAGVHQIPAAFFPTWIRQFPEQLYHQFILKGDAMKLNGNLQRALDFYIAAGCTDHRNKMLYGGVDSLKIIETSGDIAKSYLSISEKAALKGNPAIAAQYFRDAEFILNKYGISGEKPSWFRTYESWLFLYYESQAIEALKMKRPRKALEYLDEIRDHCSASGAYPCPELLHEWIREARQGVYLELISKAQMLMAADEWSESEYVYRQARDIRTRGGYRIAKSPDEAALEWKFRQVQYDTWVDEGKRLFNREEYASALFYLNKADYLEKSGVLAADQQLHEYRSHASRQIILQLMSEGRLKAWAHDYESAGKIISQVNHMLSEYSYSKEDSLYTLSRELAASIRRSECDGIIARYDTLLNRSYAAEEAGDFITAYSRANDAVNYSMANLKCRIGDEEAWYRKMNLEAMAVYQRKEHQLNIMNPAMAGDYLNAYHDLRKYYYKNKLLERGVNLEPLSEKLQKRSDPEFLMKMAAFFTGQRDREYSLIIFHRMEMLGMDPAMTGEMQISLAKYLAIQDFAREKDAQPWELLKEYGVTGNYFKSFRWSYKRSWLKESGWKLKDWPVIWTK